MANLTADQKLQKAVTETSGTTMTMSPKDGTRWTGYLLQQKVKFEADSHDKLCILMTENIEKNREAVELTKRQTKPFKYEKK